eukprot:12937874-Alexandrium_andersonii.AAC.1
MRQRRAQGQKAGLKTARTKWIFDRQCQRHSVACSFYTRSNQLSGVPLPRSSPCDPRSACSPARYQQRGFQQRNASHASQTSVA